MIFGVLDPSPLTVCINCSFFTFISNKFAKYHILFNTSTTSAHELPWKADVDEQVPVG